MKNIYEADTIQELTQRLNTLTPETKGQWGKMNVSQMLAHCCTPIEVALGEKMPKAAFIGKLIGRFVKGVVTNEKPFKQNMPTDKSFIVTDSRNFEQEKKKLLNLLNRMQSGGPTAMANKKHPFFGPMTPKEWSNATYKHMDHHLKQFGA